MSMVRRQLPLVACAALSVGACDDGGGNGSSNNAGTGPNSASLDRIEQTLRAFCLRADECGLGGSSSSSSSDSGSGSSSSSSSSSGSVSRSVRAPSGFALAKQRRPINKAGDSVAQCEARLQDDWGDDYADRSEECTDALLDLIDCFANERSCGQFAEEKSCPQFAPKARLCGWQG